MADWVNKTIPQTVAAMARVVRKVRFIIVLRRSPNFDKFGYLASHLQVRATPLQIVQVILAPP